MSATMSMGNKIPVDGRLPNIQAQMATEIIDIGPTPALDIPVIMEAIMISDHWRGVR